MSLPQGTRLDVQIAYDNSGGNPRNPRTPPGRVQWGEQSIDEMGSVTEQVVAVHKEDEAVLQKFFVDRARAAIAEGTKDGTAQRFLRSQQQTAQQ